MTKEQFESVKYFMSKLGYGNTMDIAAGLWANDLKEKYDTVDGAFIPVPLFYIKKKYRKQMKRDQKHLMRKVLDMENYEL